MSVTFFSSSFLALSCILHSAVFYSFCIMSFFSFFSSFYLYISFFSSIYLCIVAFCILFIIIIYYNYIILFYFISVLSISFIVLYCYAYFNSVWAALLSIINSLRSRLHARRVVRRKYDSITV